MESTITRNDKGDLFQVEVDALGSRVWVNAEDGSSIARFNTKMGIDIHNTATAQMSGEPECLWCTHQPPTYKDWTNFLMKIKDIYGVLISVDAIDVGLLAS